MQDTHTPETITATKKGSPQINHSPGSKGSREWGAVHTVSCEPPTVGFGTLCPEQRSSGDAGLPPAAEGPPACAPGHSFHCVAQSLLGALLPDPATPGVHTHN